MENILTGRNAADSVDAYFDAHNRYDRAGLIALFDADSRYVDTTMTASIRVADLTPFF